MILAGTGMEIHFMRLPAFKAAVCFAAGIVLSSYLPVSPGLLFALSSFVGIVLLLIAWFDRRKNRERFPGSSGFFLLLIFLGAFWNQFQLTRIERSIERFADTKEVLSIHGIVQEEPGDQGFRKNIIVEAFALQRGKQNLPTSGMFLVHYYRNKFLPHDSLANIHLGDTVLLKCRLRIPPTQRNPGEFDYRQFLLSQSIVATANVSGGANLVRVSREQQHRFTEHPIAWLRAGIQSSIRAHFRARESAFIEGLLLGDRSFIQNDIIEAFTRTGTIHILSVSGSHVGMILLILYALLGRFSRIQRSLIAIVLLVLYVFITGNSPPAVRAVLMAVTLIGGSLMQRQSHPANSIAFAALLLLIHNPQNIFLVGFQLSFAAVFSMLILYPGIRKPLHTIRVVGRSVILSYIVDLLALTFSIQIGTAPLLFYHFGTFSIVGFAANLFVVPLMFLVLSGSIAVIASASILGFLATLFANATSLILSISIHLVGWLSRIPFASIETPRPSIILCILYVAMILYLFTVGKRKIPFAICLALVGIATFATSKRVVEILFPSKSQLRITVLDIGQGDAIDVEFPSRKHLLIDTGPRSEFTDAGRRTIAPYYQRRSVSSLDALCLTHPDEDHIGGAESILRSMDVRRLYRSKFASNAQQRIDSVARSSGVAVQEISAGEIIRIDPDVRVYVLHPSNRFTDTSASLAGETNNSSLVLLIVFGKTSFLLAGDIEREAEAQLVAQYDTFIKADVLKIAHHGSTTSSTPDFLLKAKPRMAIISCGKLNRFNHPREEILTRLRMMHVETHRTDEEGAVVFESDGEEIRKVDWR